MTLKPWGSYEVLISNEYYTLKELIIKPRQRLSYQSHSNRIEQWYITGNALVIIDDKAITINGHGELFIEKNQKHRIENISNQDLIVYEVWIGTSDESDIIRYADDYQRV